MHLESADKLGTPKESRDRVIHSNVIFDTFSTGKQTDFYRK